MNGSRFHIEVNSIKLDDMAVRFNIFGDTLAQVTADLEQVIAYVSAPAAIAPQKSRATTVQPSAPAGICCACGPPFPFVIARSPQATRQSIPPHPQKRHCERSAAICPSVALCHGKDNGKSFAAFKCQACAKWQPEAKS